MRAYIYIEDGLTLPQEAEDKTREFLLYSFRDITPEHFLRLFAEYRLWEYLRLDNQSVLAAVYDALIDRINEICTLFPPSGITIIVECNGVKYAIPNPQNHTIHEQFIY